MESDGLEVDVQISENIKIEKTNKEYLNSISESKNSVKKLAKINKLIGKSDVVGRGIKITIDTSTTSDITAITLLQIVNDLNSAGAEAISINGNRIVSMTDIMDINKEYILIDSNCISSPYIIEAVGNVSNLKYAINLENSTISKLRKNGKIINERYKILTKIKKYAVIRGQDKLISTYIK